MRKVKATELPSSLYARRVKGLAKTGENGECSGKHKAGLSTPGRTEHSTKDKTSVPFADGDNYSRNYSRRP